MSLNSDFQKLYKKGFVLKKEGVILRVVANQNKGLRVAFCISKKAIQSAVQRNKAKRWGREIFREMEDLKDVSGDFLIMVLSNKEGYESFKKKLQEMVQETNRKLFSKDSSFSNSLL